MKQILYYSAETAFAADQRRHGGDGTNVVSTIRGVALAEDTMNAFYSYGNVATAKTAYTVTVHYRCTCVSTSGYITVRPDDTYTVETYVGKSVDFFIPGKEIENCIPESGSEGRTVSVGNNVDVTFWYYLLTNCIECVYEVTDTSAPTKITNNLNPNELFFVEIDGERYSRMTTAYEEFTFSKRGKHTVKIYQYPGSGYADAIRYGCFSGTNLVSITFSDHINYIADAAFADCTFLTGFTVPDSVTDLGGTNVFKGCTSLKKLIIGNNVTTTSFLRGLIGNESIEEVIIGDKIPAIPQYTIYTGTDSDTEYVGPFYGCTNLKKVLIGTGVTSIAQCAFSGTKITNLVLPDSVTTLLGRATFAPPAGGTFEGMQYVTAITFGTGITSITSDTYMFNGCEKLERLVLTSPTVVTMTAVGSGEPDPLTWLGGSFRCTMWDGDWNCRGLYNQDKPKIYVPYYLIDTYKESTGWSVLVEYCPDTFKTL